MKNLKASVIAFLLLFCALAVTTASAQTPGLLKKTTYKTDRFDFGSGGTVSVIGAPTGSISVEGWQKEEIEITAEIEVQGANEADLAALSQVTGFTLDESLGRASIISVGIHSGTKKARKKLPKHLANLPFRIDYKIKVPRYSDVSIDGGNGNLSVAGIDGTLRINFLNSDAKLDLVGGSTYATFGAGTVEVNIPSQNWRGRSADIQIAKGDLNVSLPANISSEIDATVLRTGKIENEFAQMKPRSRNVVFTEKSVVARSGSGAVPLKFTVGEGTLRLFEAAKGQ